MPEVSYRLLRVPAGPGVAQLCMTGEFDADNAIALLTFLRAAVHDADVHRIAVDMSGTSFLDSSGVRSLIIARVDAETAGKQLLIQSPQPAVRRVLEILGLTDLLLPN